MSSIFLLAVLGKVQNMPARTVKTGNVEACFYKSPYSNTLSVVNSEKTFLNKAAGFLSHTTSPQIFFRV